jgi:hypothetical protein
VPWLWGFKGFLGKLNSDIASSNIIEAYLVVFIEMAEKTLNHTTYTSRDVRYQSLDYFQILIYESSDI